VKLFASSALQIWREVLNASELKGGRGTFDGRRETKVGRKTIAVPTKVKKNRGEKEREKCHITEAVSSPRKTRGELTAKDKQQKPSKPYEGERGRDHSSFFVEILEKSSKSGRRGKRRGN